MASLEERRELQRRLNEQRLNWAKAHEDDPNDEVRGNAQGILAEQDDDFPETQF